MGLEKFLKKFDFFGIQTHPIPLNPHGLRANRTSPYGGLKGVTFIYIYIYIYGWSLKVQSVFFSTSFGLR
jgi:hypothetical protein